ncbi:hypothetical protein KI387_024551, partial [Taxus chinensis]
AVCSWDSWDAKSRIGRKRKKLPKSFVPGSPGQLGQRYTRDADRPVWRKSVHFGWFGDICPGQSGTVGTEVREVRVGHESA